MAEDKRIDELTQATELGDDDLFVLQQQGEAKSLSGAVLKELLGGGSGDDESATSAAESAAAAQASAEAAAASAAAAERSASSAASSKSEAETASMNAINAYQSIVSLDKDINKKAEEASDSAADAAGFASEAESAKDAAQTAQGKAKTARSEAETFRNDARTSANEAAQHATAASEAKDAAEVAETSANNSANAASNAAFNAARSASAASTSASTASDAADDAYQSSLNAASHKSNAELYASQASSSANSAKNYAAQASTSASTAAMSESNAATSANEAKGYRDEVAEMLENAEIAPANAVLVIAQTLTEEQKAQARENIGAAADEDTTVHNAVGTTFPPAQKPGGADFEGYDIDIVNAMADDVFAYIDEVVSGKETVTKEIMGKDASGAYDIARYTYANREYLAWVRENYPKMYAWKNGNTVKYTQSVSPRIDEKAYDLPYLHTVTTGGGETIPAFTNLKDQCTFKHGQRYSFSGKVFKTNSGKTYVIIPVPSAKTTVTIRMKGFTQDSNYQEWYGGPSTTSFDENLGYPVEADQWGVLTKDADGVYTATLTKTTACKYIGVSMVGADASAFADCIITVDEPIEYTTGGGVEVEGGTPITAVSATRRSRTIGGVEYVRYADGDVEPTVIYTDKDDDRNSNATITKDGNTYSRYPLGDLGANRTKLTPVFIYANEHGYIPNHTYEGHETKMCALVAARFLRDLAAGKQAKNPLYQYIRENCMIVVIPVANPFGYNINLTGGSGINSGADASGYMNANRCNINRNYDTPGWDYMHENEVVNDNWYGHYPGSQNETQYIMNTMVESGAVVAMSLHGHSGGANLGAVQGQDPDGTYFNEDGMSAISDFLEANYGYKLVDYDVSIDHGYSEVGAHNMPDVTCKSPSYITQCGAYGGIVEFSPFEADATSKVVTYSSTVIGNAYAQTINLIAMWLSDYLEA